MKLTPKGAARCFTIGLFSTPVYASLNTGIPTTGNEQSGNAYARALVPTYDAADAAATGWTISEAASYAQAVLNGERSWPTPTGTWSDPTYVGLWDAATGGNLLAWMPLSVDVDAPVSGASVRLANGAVVIRIPAGLS